LASLLFGVAMMVISFHLHQINLIYCIASVD